MVATQLGGGRWRGARHSARVALCLAAAVMAVAGAIIGAGRNVWPRLFTHDAQVRPVGTAQPLSMMLQLPLALKSCTRKAMIKRRAAVVTVAPELARQVSAWLTCTQCAAWVLAGNSSGLMPASHLMACSTRML